MTEKKSKLTKRDIQRIETRNLVFEAALDEFKRVGVANAQIEAIVKKANVSIGTYYRYFPSKDDVLFELMLRYITELADIAATTNSNKRSLSLQKQLASMIDILFTFYEQQDETLVREVFGIVVKQQPRDFDWISIPLLIPVIEGFESAYHRGESIYPDPARPTRLFFTAILGFITAMNPVRCREEAEEFVQLFLRGIRP